MKKRVLSALLALCLTLSLAGAAFAENEPFGETSSPVSEYADTTEPEAGETPVPSAEPAASGTPAPTAEPEAGETPVPAEEPDDTETPAPTVEPDDVETPAPTVEPEADPSSEEADSSKDESVVESPVILPNRMPAKAMANVLDADERAMSNWVPAHKKYVTDNGDGTYTLSLDVTGRVEAEQEQVPVDLIYVLDTTDSMKQHMSDTTPRSEALEEAVAGLNKSLLEMSDILDVDVSLITFSNDVSERFESRPLEETTYKWQERTGMTNYYNALTSTQQLITKLDQSNPSSLKVVVFVSDGGPNAGGGYDDNDIDHDGNTSEFLHGDDAALCGAVELTPDYFFAVYVGDANERYDGTGDLAQTNFELMQMVAAAATKVPAGHSEAFQSNDTADLVAKFKSMASTITYAGGTDVTISDTFSKYAEPVEDAALTIKVTGPDGFKTEGIGSIDLGGGKAITAQWTKDTSNQTSGFTLEFPTDYMLKNGYTYTVSTTIQPTQYAKDHPEEGNQTGATGTGPTSAGEEGFPSNEKAELKYTPSGATEAKTLPYPKPVIQVPTGTVKIYKTFTGLDDAQKQSVADSLTFTLTNKENSNVSFTSGNLTAEGDHYTVTINNVTPGTYTLSENGNTTVNGYNLSTTVTDDGNTELSEIQVSAGDTTELNVVNTYTEETGTLTITKQIEGPDGIENALAGKTFNFTVTKLNSEGQVDTTYSENDFTAGVKNNVTVTIGEDGQNVSTPLTGLPAGDYRVSETGSQPAIGDFVYVRNDGPITATVMAGQTANATITNTYEHKDKTLTVKKIVAGNMATDGDEFSFTLTLQNADGTAYNGDQLTDESLTPVGNSKDSYTFTLVGSTTTPSEVSITLPYGVKATVTETEAEGYNKVEHREYAEESTGTTVTFTEGGTSNEVTMNQNYTIEFRNTKELVGPPTGLERNDKPYALMIGVAVLAGLALVGGAVIRRRRRWME